MRCWHACFMFALTFFWIWSLPMLMIGVFFAIPVALVALPFCLAVTLVVQIQSNNKIIVDHWFRKWMSRIPWHEWFPCNRLKFDDQCIVTVHPHGILCCGAVVGIHLVPDSETLLCVAPILFYVPVIGWMLRVLGCIRATKDVMRNALRAGHSLLVIPGGVPEIVLAETGDDTRRFARHGVLKLDKDMPIRVVYAKGECSTYTLIRGPFLEQRVYLSWLCNIPLVTPILLGWWGTWLPKRRRITLTSKKLHIRTKRAYTELFKELTQVKCQSSVVR